MTIADADILYLYDAKLTNPNGDPDEENKPRMDEATGRNLVSDVRLKRYLRDFWLNSGEDIWVRKREDGTTTRATERMEMFLDTFNAETDSNLKRKDARGSTEFKNWLLDRLRDIRLFGATMPMEGDSITFTGPVQFGWGYSLHRVEINNSATISSHFAGRDNPYGTFGKDWRVYYSLIGFNGLVSRARARHTRLTDEDVAALDGAMLEAIPNEATTRSKIGQLPRLYLRVEYADDARSRLGDLREDVKPDPKEDKRLDALRDVRDYRLDVGALVERVSGREAQIQAVHLHVNPDLDTSLEADLSNVLGDRLTVF
ncbi:MAG: type I-B CRISPR-associated protein Cas7/Csh2 [Rubrobacter sp.]|nr:type I-B CRISPR-associated protein Cas7/Csh2 [Rubrobacter sp.]